MGGFPAISYHDVASSTLSYARAKVMRPTSREDWVTMVVDAQVSLLDDGYLAITRQSRIVDIGSRGLYANLHNIMHHCVILLQAQVNLQLKMIGHVM